MTIKPDILFFEGAQHNVTFTVPNTIVLANYNSAITVSESANSDTILLSFNSLSGNGLTNVVTTVTGTTVQTILLTIPASLTAGLSGVYKYQLKLWSTIDDSIKFPINNFIIKPAVI